MRSRLLVIATLVGGIVLFAWQFISHGALKLPEKGMREFPNDSATATAAHALRALAPENGVYFSRYGIYASVGIGPTFGDKTKDFVPMMLEQLVLDFVVVLVLALLFDRVGATSVVTTGAAYAALALAFAGLVFVSNWIWWDFPMSWTLGNVADQVIGFFLLGVTFAVLRNRFGEQRATTAERPGVRAPGGLTTGEPRMRTPR